jgi:hypothetical protein
MHPDKIFIWVNGARTSLTDLAAMNKPFQRKNYYDHLLL